MIHLMSGVMSVLATVAAYLLCNDLTYSTKTGKNKYKTITTATTIATLAVSLVIGTWISNVQYSKQLKDDSEIIFNLIIVIAVGVIIGIVGHELLKMMFESVSAKEKKLKQQLKHLNIEPIASNKTQLIAQFYELCQSKGYTDMRDDVQSLKAKVIATDLGLRYGNIVEFYEKAARCYQQIQVEKAEEAEKLRIQRQKEQAEKARRAVNGTLLVTVSGNKETLKVFLRPDNTVYCTVNDGEKIEGIPSVTVHKGGSLQYTYHPSETVFTGASSGGIMMGGTHQTEAHYTERVAKSGKGYIQVGIGGTEVPVTWITMSDYTRERFKRDAQFKAFVSNGRIRCTKDSEMANMLTHSALMGGGNIYTQMSQLTMAADEKRLPYETCREIANLLGRVIHGNFPPTDEEIYDCAKSLAESKTSAQLLSAIEMFRDISDYKDASTQIKSVQIKYEEVLQEEKEQAILDREARSRCTKRITLIAIVFLVTLTAAVFIRTSITKNNAYRNAVSLMDEGDYEKAITAFEALDGYKDSNTQIIECHYLAATALMHEAKYEEAIAAFEALDGYKNSADQIVNCEYGIAIAEQTRIEAEKAAVYAKAEEWAKNGEYTKAAITFAKLGNYRDSNSKSASSWDSFHKNQFSVLAEGYEHIATISKDGTLWYEGSNQYGQCDLADWENIVAIHAGLLHTVGLTKNGTVIATGYREDSRCDVSNWKNVMDIDAGYYHTVALFMDGTVAATGRNKYGENNVSKWNDIIAVSAGGFHTVGLKTDGTVIATGKNEYGQCDVADWYNIVAISAGELQTIGLKSDGTVVATGYSDDGRCDVSNWTDIVTVFAGNLHTVGLKNDGSVMVAGYNKYGECNISDWEDMSAICAGWRQTIGLKFDGTVVAAGTDQYGACEANDWKNIAPTE